MGDYWETARILMLRPSKEFPDERRWWPLNGAWYAGTWLVLWAPERYVVNGVRSGLYWLNQGREGSRWWCPAPGDHVTSCMGRGQMCEVVSVDIPGREVRIKLQDGSFATAPWVCIELEAPVSERK